MPGYGFDDPIGIDTCIEDPGDVKWVKEGGCEDIADITSEEEGFGVIGERDGRGDDRGVGFEPVRVSTGKMSA